MEDQLADIAKKLATPPKGILAADESTKTCTERFKSVGVESTEESRRAYRGLLVTTPNLGGYLSGIIMVDETIRQKANNGTSFIDILRKQGVEPGIKVDGGLVQYDGAESLEKVTDGLTGLQARMEEYAKLGGTFAKWRAAFSIGNGLPTDGCIKENARRMAEYVHTCQDVGIVPIVEPEVLMDGTHTAEEAERAIGKAIAGTMHELATHDVYLPGLILKTSMAVSGKDAANRADPEEVATRTLNVLKANVPDDIGGVVFLSGGQADDEANANFDAIMARRDEVPFPMTFSFARAFQREVLEYWAKNPDDVVGAQALLIEKIKNLVA